mgnify:CR=1 FL=1
MAEKLIETIDLENNLQLKLFDGSRKIAADRHQLKLIARIEVPVEMALPTGDDTSDVSREKLNDILGNTAIFEQVRERNFVEDEKKDEVFQDLRQSILNHARQYYAHPDFGKKFILRQFNDATKRRTGYR